MTIKPIDMCSTPESYEEINDFITALPKGEQANATIVMMMTHNFLAKAINDDSVKQN